MTAASALAAFFTLALAAAPSPASGQASPTPDRQVVLTFNDLPMTGGPSCDPRLVREVTERLTEFLDSRSMPATGLASPGRQCFDAALLRETLGRWREIGAVVGNHTATHPDLNSTPVDDYLANVDRAQWLIEEAVGLEPRWFRPPYLHMGDDARSKAALERLLSANDYRLAPVTVDNQEWVYAAVSSSTFTCRSLPAMNAWPSCGGTTTRCAGTQRTRRRRSEHSRSSVPAASASATTSRVCTDDRAGDRRGKRMPRLAWGAVRRATPVAIRPRTSRRQWVRSQELHRSHPGR